MGLSSLVRHTISGISAVGSLRRVLRSVIECRLQLRKRILCKGSSYGQCENEVLNNKSQRRR